MTRLAGLGFGVVLLLVLGNLLLADVAEVNGKWDLTVSTPRGEMTRSAEFVLDGESLKVISQGRNGQKIEGRGTVKDSHIQWSVTRETPRGTIEITYDGKIDGGSMKGSVQFGSRGSGEWSAQKAE